MYPKILNKGLSNGMRLSALQRSILRECYQSKQPHISRQPFAKFYPPKTPPTKIVNSVTALLERLIDKGLMIGFGRRTPEKWFIEQVRLTPLGRRIAKQSFGQQQRLPLT